MPKWAELRQRQPYPLTWDEQRLLFGLLPKRLADMALFKVNTGSREQEGCGLRWRWEQPVPELETTASVVPGECVKNGRRRLIVPNGAARAVTEAYRGQHPEFLSPRRGQRLMSMNNAGWQRARDRAAGVGFETRQALLGHHNGSVTTHYAAAGIAPSSTR